MAIVIQFFLMEVVKQQNVFISVHLDFSLDQTGP